MRNLVRYGVLGFRGHGLLHKFFQLQHWEDPYALFLRMGGYISGTTYLILGCRDWIAYAIPMRPLIHSICF